MFCASKGESVKPGAYRVKLGRLTEEVFEDRAERGQLLDRHGHPVLHERRPRVLAGRLSTRSTV